MADFYDQINPVTGRSYNERFASAPGNPLNAMYSQNRPTYTRRKTPEQLAHEERLGQVGESVASGANFEPYQNQLNSALSRYESLLTNPSSFTGTPGYQAALEGGTQAINRSAAARGMSNSGNVLAELAKYGSGLASQEYGAQVGRQGEEINRLAELMRGSQRFGLESGYYQPPQRYRGAITNQPPSASWY